MEVLQDVTSGKAQVKLDDLLYARVLNILCYGKLSNIRQTKKQYTVRNIWGWNPNFQVAAVNPVPLVGGCSSGDRAPGECPLVMPQPTWCWDQGLLCQVLLPARLAGPWESGVCSFLTFGFLIIDSSCIKRGHVFLLVFSIFFFLSGLFGVRAVTASSWSQLRWRLSP